MITFEYMQSYIRHYWAKNGSPRIRNGITEIRLFCKWTTDVNYIIKWNTDADYNRFIDEYWFTD